MGGTAGPAGSGAPRGLRGSLQPRKVGPRAQRAGSSRRPAVGIPRWRPHGERLRFPPPRPHMWGTLGSWGPRVVTGFPSCASTSSASRTAGTLDRPNDRALRRPGERGSARARPTRRRACPVFLQQPGARPRDQCGARRERGEGAARAPGGPSGLGPRATEAFSTQSSAYRFIYDFSFVRQILFIEFLFHGKDCFVH